MSFVFWDIFYGFIAAQLVMALLGAIIKTFVIPFYMEFKMWRAERKFKKSK